MPRPPRLEFPGALYHVIARGNDRQLIFRDDLDREYYVSRISHYSSRYAFRLLAYCLMPNHVHLAVRTADVPLSRIMAGLHSSYTQRFNRRHGRVGHVFQGRYKSFLVQEDRYLIALLRYINLNPVSAAIVGCASDYAWSSDRFLRSGLAPDWFDARGALESLGATREAAIARYVHLVGGRCNHGELELPAIGQAVEGDEIFARERFAAAHALQPKLRGLSEERLLEAVAMETGVSAARLQGPQRGGETASARCLLAYVGCRLGGISIRRISRLLNRDGSTLVRPVARLEGQLKSDPSLQSRIDRIVDRLSGVTGAKSANQD
jgi:REP element-mobilizing transposase RayT